MAGKSVNKVILIGNLGKDPELRATPSGTPVAKFTLATNDRYKDKEGQWQDRTEWHNITAWARTAEIAGEYLKKGSKVYIEGSLRTHSWDDKQTGQKKYMTEDRRERFGPAGWPRRSGWRRRLRRKLAWRSVGWKQLRSAHAGTGAGRGFVAHQR